MKYMSFNSSCAYAGMANMLECMGVETSDRDIALDMGLPYLFDHANGTYLGGAMLQTARWFDLYLRPHGLAMREERMPKEAICARLAGMDCAMIGILVAPGSRHAVVYTGCADGRYHFVNNKWPNSDEPDHLVFTQAELLARLDDSATLAWIEPTAPERAEMQPHFRRSIEVLQQMLADMDAFCATQRPPQELRERLNPLFRALLLDGVAMLELIDEDALCAELRALQAQLMSVLRSGEPVCLKDALDMPRLHAAVEDYVALIGKRLTREKLTRENSILKGKKVILFDMDGTLIDSIGMWNEVDRQLLAHLGETQMDEAAIQARRDRLLREHAGAENPYLAYCCALGEVYRSPLSPEEIKRIRYAAAQDYLENRLDYKPGVPEFLYALKARGYRLAIGTTGNKSNVDILRTKNKNVLAKAPMDEVFERIYTQADVREIKPNPEIYLKLMRDMGADPAECLIFEDSLAGVEAANNAGVDVIAVYDRYSDADWAEILRRAKAGYRSYAEIMQALEM